MSWRNRRGGNWYPQQGSSKPSTFVSHESLESEHLVTLSTYDTARGRMATLCVYKLSATRILTGIRVWEEIHRDASMTAADGLVEFTAYVNGKTNSEPDTL